MKYNRTKNGIEIYPESVIAQSDTIEDLCDFVMVKHHWEKLPNVYNIKELKDKVKNLHGSSANIMDNYKFLIEQSKKPNSPAWLKLDYIKFAINTERGLIYVAEMNEDGELVLI